MDPVSTVMSRRVVAILSDCDLTVAVDTLLSPGRGGDLVRAEPARVHPDDDLPRAAEVMLDALVDAILAADETGRVVGIVTWTDLVAHVAGRHLGDGGRQPARP